MLYKNKKFRTNEEFRSRMDQQHHQNLEQSPMEKLPINMIRNFNLDYLHVALLGATRKTLNILMRKTKDKFPLHSTLRSKLRKTNIEAINLAIKEAHRTQPGEIQRSIRTLDYIAVMKGKEFRSFILYYGIVSLKDNVHTDIYENFLTLHIALTICLAEEHRRYLPIAQMCFEKYVQDFKKIYGAHQVSYNIHSLLHLVDEVKQWGVLDNFSTFPFENKLGFLKNLPHSGYLPLEQTVCRYLESLPQNIKSFKTEYYKKGKEYFSYN